MAGGTLTVDPNFLKLRKLKTFRRLICLLIVREYQRIIQKIVYMILKMEFQYTNSSLSRKFADFALKLVHRGWERGVGGWLMRESGWSVFRVCTT